MNVIVGADHRGFSLKEKIKVMLQGREYTVIDAGAHTYEEGDNYTKIARDVATRVLADAKNVGIVICGSGVGVAMVANKTKGIRCGLGISKEQVIASRQDDDITVLAIAADYTDEAVAKDMVEAFLTTPFSNEERHKKRLAEIVKLENTL